MNALLFAGNAKNVPNLGTKPSKFLGLGKRGELGNIKGLIIRKQKVNYFEALLKLREFMILCGGGMGLLIEIVRNGLETFGKNYDNFFLVEGGKK